MGDREILISSEFLPLNSILRFEKKKKRNNKEDKSEKYRKYSS